MFYQNNFYRDDLRSVLECIEPVIDLKGCAVLVTGASGLIGSFLVDFLMYCNEVLSCEINVYAMSRNSSYLSKRFTSHLSNNLFHILQHDVTVPLNGEIHFDYIIHAASNAYPKLFSTDPVGTITSNIFGVYNLLEYIRHKGGRRFLFISSGEVYGQRSFSEKGIDESSYGYVDINDSRSCYPNAKRLAETLCVSYAKQFGIDTVIARPCHTYGPTATPSDNRVSAQFINTALAGNDIVLKSHGKQLRSYCYVSDCVSGILTVLLKGVSAHAYNIANAESKVSIREMAEIIAELCGVEVCFELPTDVEKAIFNPMENAVLNADKLQKLGWIGNYGIREGIKRTIRIVKDLQNVF